ncbi:hypothetical protein PI125_g20049 [Phytophthora idaei]|nr:hypothetical protein PI125_g20049 [Phytophthora idaei]
MLEEQEARNCGKKSLQRSEVIAEVAAVPTKDRQVIRKTAAAAGVSAYQVRELLNSGELSRRSGRIKPSLTAENKLRRVEWAMSFVDEDSLEFEYFDDIVMIDEK